MDALTSILSPLAGRGGGALGSDLGRFLYPLDEISVGNGSRQRRDNVNMISDAANAHHFGTEITADGGKISMHPWPYVQTKPRLAIFGAKDDVNDDPT